jgi:hypothetical protein
MPQLYCQIMDTTFLHMGGGEPVVGIARKICSIFLTVDALEIVRESLYGCGGGRNRMTLTGRMSYS